ncbi:hypothetical protein L0F63_002414 [Massospora cicadina]|nr:hypothetical protein L0F63_002414 [Massospora cicadina]
MKLTLVQVLALALITGKLNTAALDLSRRSATLSPTNLDTANAEVSGFSSNQKPQALEGSEADPNCEESELEPKEENSSYNQTEECEDDDSTEPNNAITNHETTEKSVLGPTSSLKSETNVASKATTESKLSVPEVPEDGDKPLSSKLEVQEDEEDCDGTIEAIPEITKQMTSGDKVPQSPSEPTSITTTEESDCDDGPVTHPRVPHFTVNTPVQVTHTQDSKVGCSSDEDCNIKQQTEIPLTTDAYGSPELFNPGNGNNGDKVIVDSFPEGNKGRYDDGSNVMPKTETTGHVQEPSTESAKKKVVKRPSSKLNKNPSDVYEQSEYSVLKDGNKEVKVEKNNCTEDVEDCHINNYINTPKAETTENGVVSPSKFTKNKIDPSNPSKQISNSNNVYGTPEYTSPKAGHKKSKGMEIKQINNLTPKLKTENSIPILSSKLISSSKDAYGSPELFNPGNGNNGDKVIVDSFPEGNKGRYDDGSNVMPKTETTGHVQEPSTESAKKKVVKRPSSKLNSNPNVEDVHKQVAYDSECSDYELKEGCIEGSVDCIVANQPKATPGTPSFQNPSPNLEEVPEQPKVLDFDNRDPEPSKFDKEYECLEGQDCGQSFQPTPIPNKSKDTTIVTPSNPNSITKITQVTEQPEAPKVDITDPECSEDEIVYQCEEGQNCGNSDQPTPSPSKPKTSLVTPSNMKSNTKGATVPEQPEASESDNIDPECSEDEIVSQCEEGQDCGQSDQPTPILNKSKDTTLVTPSNLSITENTQVTEQPDTSEPEADLECSDDEQVLDCENSENCNTEPTTNTVGTEQTNAIHPRKAGQTPSAEPTDCDFDCEFRKPEVIKDPELSECSDTDKGDSESTPTTIHDPQM